MYVSPLLDEKSEANYDAGDYHDTESQVQSSETKEACAQPATVNANFVLKLLRFFDAVVSTHALVADGAEVVTRPGASKPAASGATLSRFFVSEKMVVHYFLHFYQNNKSYIN